MDEGTPQTRFDDQSQPLDQIIKTSNLPLCVRFDQSQQLDPHLIPPDFDMTETLLLHSVYKCRRVQGRNASFRLDTKSFGDMGQDVIIDEAYAGWFAVFGNPSDHPNDPVVPHFRNIGKLAISPCQTFLVSGKQPFEAMKIITNASGKRIMKPFQVPPGTVLTKGGMYTVSLVIRTKKSLFKKKVVKKEEMFLSCCDELNNEMLISCQTQGIFYVLTQQSAHMKAPIMKMDHIVSRYRFPLLVKLVHGEMIKMPRASSGTFILLKSDQLQMVCASTAFTPQPAYFELSSGTSLRFFKATSTSYPDTSAPDNCLRGVYMNLKAIRFKNNDLNLSSARSSATSGLGSQYSEMSEEDDRVDWSRVTVLSNSAFVECVDECDECRSLFTHHKDTSCSTLKTKLPLGKDKPTKIETKAIKRTKMYESPSSLSETIPIRTQRRSSSGSNTSSPTRANESQYVNRRPSTPTSPTPASPTFTETDENQQTEYGEIWNDNTSVISGESLEVVVENVSATNILSGSGEDETESNSSSSEIGTAGESSPSSVASLKEVDGHTYDVLYRSGDRDSRHSYFTMSLKTSELSARATPEVKLKGQTGVENQLQYPDSQTLLLRNISKSGPESDNRPTSYEVPVNLRGHNEAQNGNHSADYQILSMSMRGSSVIYEEPNSSTYENTGQGINGRPKSSVYDVPNSNRTVNDYDDDTNHYERFDDIYEHINPEPEKIPREQLAGKPRQYYNLFEVPSVPRNSGYKNASSHYLAPSSDEKYVSSDPADSKHRNKTDSGVYVNSSSSEVGLGKLDKLISNIKGLGLKPATEEAIIRNTNLEQLKSALEDGDIKTQLIDIFPGVSKIDLNKISLFMDGS